MKTYIVNSFTDHPFKGNPAGVCLVNSGIEDSQIDESTMQSIAKELNFSETAFVTQRKESNQYSIRYFSPMMEIPLCGHATLASAKVLFQNEPGVDAIKLITGQGLELTVQRAGEQIVMEFPVYQVEPKTIPDSLLQSIGITNYVNCVFNQETEIVLLEIDCSRKLANLTPDFQAMVASYQGIHGLLVTASSGDDEFDFHSRFFWPWSGGQEDPVTGGTHTFLARYWSERLGKSKMRSFQSSARTGSMDVELIDNDKLLITANAVILFEGTWVGSLV